MGYQNLPRAKEYLVSLALMANDEFPFASTPEHCRPATRLHARDATARDATACSPHDATACSSRIATKSMTFFILHHSGILVLQINF